MFNAASRKPDFLNFLPFSPPNWSIIPSLNSIRKSPSFKTILCSSYDVEMDEFPIGRFVGENSIISFSRRIQSGLFAPDQIKVFEPASKQQSEISIPSLIVSEC